MFAFVVELHLRSYQERKCESLQSSFKLNSLSNFKSFRLRTTAVLGLQSKCKETVNKSWMENGKKTRLRRQCCYRKWEMLIFLNERASRGQSPRLIGFFKLSSNGCSPHPTQHYCNTNYFRPIHYFPTTAIIVCSIIVSSLRAFARNFLRKFWF